MKSLHILWALGLMFCSVAWGQGQVRSDAPETTANRSSVYSGRSLTAFYSEANEMGFEVGDNNGSMNTSGAFGLGFRFSDIQTREFGYMVGFNFEFPREIGSVTVEGVEQSLPSREQPTLSFLYFDPSLTYGFTDKAYMVGGITYTVPTSGEIKGFEIRGDWGLQFGGGLRFSDKWLVELMYREANFQMEGSSAITDSGVALFAVNERLDFDEVGFRGLVLRMSYLID